MRTLTSFFGLLMLIALIIGLIWWILACSASVVDHESIAASR